MTQFQTLASGSSGNAALLSHGDTHILLDMGISCRRILQALLHRGLRPEDLTGILITHEHSDHIQGLATYYKKYRTPLYCTPGTARQIRYRTAGVDPYLRQVAMCAPFPVGNAVAMALPTSHDCSESSAYLIKTVDGSLGYLTDTGYILQRTGEDLLGADVLLLESNHDEEAVRSGPYPYSLKERVLGPEGHLSNEAAAAYAAASAKAGTGTVILAHLSTENNTPEMARTIVGRALETVHFRGRLLVAPRSEPGEICTWGRPSCSV